LPLDAWRVCGLRWEHDVEQLLVILALLQVGACYLPCRDVIVPALDVVKGGFRRFPRVGIRGRGNDFLQGRGRYLSLRVREGRGKLGDGLGSLKLDGGLV